MELTSTEIVELIEAPKNGASLVKAVHHERKVQVHTQPVDNPTDYNDGHTNFLTWVKTVVGNKEKFERFLQFLKFPYSTNEVTGAIFEKLSKVFESRNSFRKYDFKTPDNEQDFIEYLSDISDSFFWKSDVWNAIQNNINSVVVIDMRSESEAKPEPYSYDVKTKDIVDMGVTLVRATTVDK